jgi:anaerobic magnesium-protoporphyrin IX monomethyl ester cyclase
MSRVLFVNPQFVEGYISSARWDSISYSNTNWFPIFLSYATGLVEKNNNICKLVDAQADNLTDNDVSRIAAEFKPEFTVLYITERGLEYNLLLAAEIKKRTDSKIIFVGPWCSIVHEAVVSSDVIDYIIDGEFEYAVLDIIKGKVSKDKKYIKEQRLTTEQLNNLPWVTKVYSKHLNIKNYRVSSIKHPYVDIFSSRRCYWGKCAFCLWPVSILECGGYVERDLKDTLDEIEWAVKNLKIKEVFLQDDTLAPIRAKELSEGMIKRGINISWACYARGDLALSQETIDLMKKSGCHVVHIGFESGNDDILKKMDKGVTTESLREVTRRFNNAGIAVHADVMVGNIGESRKTVQDTIDFIKSLDGIDILQMAPPKLYKKCNLYKWYADNKEGAFIDKRGLPNLKDMTYEDMVSECKRGLREFYTSRKFLTRAITHPSLMKQVLGSAIPAIKFLFGKKKVEVPA